MNGITSFTAKAILPQPRRPRFSGGQGEGESRLSPWFLNRYHEEIFISAVSQHLESNPKEIKEWVKGLFAQHGTESAQKIISRLQPEVSQDVRKQINAERDAFLAEQK